LKRARGERADSLSRLAAADLHVHTTHSDGSCSPGEVVRAAAAINLAALAITDHDTLSGVAVARHEANRLGVELVAGIELTAEFEGREIHLLGHFVRDDDPPLVAATSTLRSARAARLQAMTERLEHCGLWIDLDVLARAFPRATLGRKHLADWLAKTGQVSDRREAFARYLGDAGPAHVPKPRLPCDRAIALIRSAGGVAGLAHPRHDWNQRSLRELVDLGLGSIEVAGPAVGHQLGQRFRSWADRLGLVPIAGTDFHAPDRPGRWVGSTTTPAADFERLRQAAMAASNGAEVALNREITIHLFEASEDNSPVVAPWR
jgi:3',5'-nucleoside bisphosphate phosphatase